jgi:hypothetical protein
MQENWCGQIKVFPHIPTPLSAALMALPPSAGSCMAGFLLAGLQLWAAPKQAHPSRSGLTLSAAGITTASLLGLLHLFQNVIGNVKNALCSLAARVALARFCVAPENTSEREAGGNDGQPTRITLPRPVLTPSPPPPQPIPPTGALANSPLT